MKLAVRIAIFLVGASALFFGWHKVHTDVAAIQNPGSTTPINSAEVLVVVGAFVLLMAFAPSPQTLGRWMSLKRPKKVQPPHFKRRRQKT